VRHAAVEPAEDGGGVQEGWATTGDGGVGDGGREGEDQEEDWED